MSVRINKSAMSEKRNTGAVGHAEAPVNRGNAHRNTQREQHDSSNLSANTPREFLAHMAFMSSHSVHDDKQPYPHCWTQQCGENHHKK